MAGGAFPFACLLKLVPRHRRFAVARRFAVLFRPYWRWRETPPRHLDGYQEIALYHVLEVASRAGIPFDAAPDIWRGEKRTPSGALILCPHFLLNRLMVGELVRSGTAVTLVVSPNLRTKGFWTTRPIEILPVSGSVLLGIRRRVVAGGVVVVIMDLQEPIRDRHPIQTPAGDRYVTDTLMRFAEREGLPVWFSATHLDSDSRIVTAMVRPSSTEADAAFSEFCRFLQAEAAEIAH